MTLRAELADGALSILQIDGAAAHLLATADLAVRVRHLDGSTDVVPYDTVVRLDETTWRATAGWQRDARRWQVQDDWIDTGSSVDLERLLVADPGPTAGGVQLHTAIMLAAPRHAQRPFVPANVYEAAQLPEAGDRSFSEGRLSYPMVASFDGSAGRVVILLRRDLAEHEEAARRRTGEQEFLHQTDVGSVGLSLTAGRVVLTADLPYYEGPGSAALDAHGSPARAYAPIPPEGAALRVAYRFAVAAAEEYSAAVHEAMRQAVLANPPTPATLPFDLSASVGFRRGSSARTYTEWGTDGAGFVLNFDPDLGYESPPRAFGASFTEHGMGSSRDILEYGFTGRQLNVALVLAATEDETWRGRRRRVCDFFVDHMVTDDGFVFSHYGMARRRPLYSVGDPDGPVLHYLVRADRPGSYLRLTTEAASDLLLNWRAVRAVGGDRSRWWDALTRVAGFLLRAQNEDGSWYRAYAPDGTGLVGGSWLGEDEAAKTATAAAIPFLLELAGEWGEGAATLGAAAERAGRYVSESQVAGSTYRGGTLDNPNVVDKESAFLAMSALLALYRATGGRDWLAAAERAARIGCSWTVLWDIPPVPGTRVARAGVRSTGWGGINSVWGAGVTDIYSLFFLRDLVELGRLVRDPLFSEIARLTAYGTAQLLSYPGDLYGMCDVGMQPEGIAHCGQGIDAGLIAKGDVWGGLGWIYTAGTSGLSDYLRQIEPDTR